jgi:hypothetical protein
MDESRRDGTAASVECRPYGTLMLVYASPHLRAGLVKFRRCAALNGRSPTFFLMTDG